MNSNNTELDTFLTVKKKRKELFQIYESVCFKYLENTNEVNLDITEIELNSKDQSILLHYLNLFLHDKQFFHQLIFVNKNFLVSLAGCQVIVKFLDSFQFILLNLVLKSIFKIKVGN